MNFRFVTVILFILMLIQPNSLFNNRKPATKVRVSVGNNKPNKPLLQKPMPRPRLKPKPEYTVRPMQQNREEIDRKEHARVCNILSFASNIFGNFVNIVRDPNNRDNLGTQVGNMAQNIFHIVAQATTKNFQTYKTNLNQTHVAEYILSDEFKQELTTLILKQLEELE